MFEVECSTFDVRKDVVQYGDGFRQFFEAGGECGQEADGIVTCGDDQHTFVPCCSSDGECVSMQREPDHVTSTPHASYVFRVLFD